MTTYNDLFDAGHFASAIQSICFEATNEHTPVMGYTSTPALIVRLKNGLILKSARYISYSDYDPCHYTIISGSEVNRTVSKWTEFDEDYGNSNVKWQDNDSEAIALETLVGQQIIAVVDYTWCTIVECSDNYVMEVREKNLRIGKWVNKTESQAVLLNHIKLEA